MPAETHQHGDLVTADEIEVDELWSSRTIGALAGVFARHRAHAGEDGDPTGRGGPT